MDDDEEHDRDEELRDMLQRFLSGNTEIDPAELANAAGLPIDPAMLTQMMTRLQQSLNQAGEGFDEKTAREQATTLASKSAVTATQAEVSGLEQALHVAALWLDEVTTITPLTLSPTLITRRGWVEATLPVWVQLASPVAESIADALTRVLTEQSPEEFREMMGDGRIFRKVGGALFAMQLGQVVGQLSQEVVSGGDIGVPLLDGSMHQAVLVPQNVSDFARDLAVPVEEVRLYLAVREIAHARLFRHAKWLRLHMLTQITDYARGIKIDIEPLEAIAAEIDLQNPQALQDAFSSGRLIPPKTPEQQLALSRLETMLALIEGWVDVVTAAATKRLPKADSIAESVRRRRAAGGPAESALSSLVGLELRPRRLREAAAMWQAVSDVLGENARDALWAHPDILPSAADIDEPDKLIARLSKSEPEQDEMDRALQELLDNPGGRPQEGDQGTQ